MKRIEFIAPVESMRGKLSGNQVLAYADNDNPAYDSPRGKVNYARNYRPSFIGAKVSKTGKAYFSVKTKTAVNMTAPALQAMALAGGTGAIYASLIKGANATAAKQVFDLKRASGAISAHITERKFYWDIIRAMLLGKSEHVVVSETYAGSTKSVTILNPWITDSTAAVAWVSRDVLVKFWDQLSNNGFTFSVDGAKGIAIEGDTFSELASYEAYNVLGIESKTVGGSSYAAIGNLFVLNANGDYILASETVVANAKYGLTSVSPA